MARNISTVYINASLQKTWETVTQAAQVKLWQFGSDLLTTWEVDSPIRFSTAWEDKVFEQWGTVLEFDAPHRVSYSLFAPRPGLEDKPENYFTMHYILSTEGGQTKLEIVQEDNRAGAVQEAPQGEENPVLAGLKQLAETA